MQSQAEFYYVIHALISYPKKGINGIKPPASTNEYAVILPETFFITPFPACPYGYLSVYLLQIFSKFNTPDAALWVGNPSYRYRANFTNF